LCEFYAAGLLSAADYVARLVRLGYNRQDAEWLAAKCGVDKGMGDYDSFDPKSTVKKKAPPKAKMGKGGAMLP
jgi:hypothetical protein